MEFEGMLIADGNARGGIAAEPCLPECPDGRLFAQGAGWRVVDQEFLLVGAGRRAAVVMQQGWAGSAMTSSS